MDRPKSLLFWSLWGKEKVKKNPNNNRKKKQQKKQQQKNNGEEERRREFREPIKRGG